jgi:hypothetical protein
MVPTRRATIGVAWLVIDIVTALNVILIVLTAADLRWRSAVADDHSASVESRVVLGGDDQDPVRSVNV